MDWKTYLNRLNINCNGQLKYTKVFLTEAQLEICIPQAFDEKPEYEAMYRRRFENERIMTSLGIEHIDLEHSKELTNAQVFQSKEIRETDLSEPTITNASRPPRPVEGRS
jgi:hypothetical protein